MPVIPTLIEDVRRTEPSQRPGLPRPGNFVDSAHAWLVKQRTLPQYRYVLVPIPPVASRFGDPGRLQQGESVGSAAVIIHRAVGSQLTTIFNGIVNQLKTT